MAYALGWRYWRGDQSCVGEENSQLRFAQFFDRPFPGPQALIAVEGTRSRLVQSKKHGRHSRMSTKLQLTLAAGDYDSIAALKDGTVTPDGIELTILTDMTAEVRHARMLRGRQFDVAELSMSN